MKYLFIALVFAASMSMAADSPKIEILDTHAKWKIYKVKSITQGKTTTIMGKMTASQAIPLAHGHIDIAAYDTDGNKITSAATHYTPGILTNRIRQRGGVTFRQNLTDVPANAVIKVAFHKEDYEMSSPEHSENIAH